MIKTLTRHGNSLALVIDKPLLESIGISATTPLQVVAAGSSLVVTRADVGIDSARLRQHSAAVRRRYGAALKRLAE